MCITISKLNDIYKIYKLYKLIKNVETLDEITDEYCLDIKNRIFAGGCIYIKFAQWIISKMKTEANYNSKLAKFTNYFEDIFDQCPYHSIEISKSSFFCETGINLDLFIKSDTLKIIASGSVGQVYYAELINPMYLVGEELYAQLGDFNHLSDTYKEIKEVAIKIKHPHINDDIEAKTKLFELLQWVQSKPYLKRLFSLHIDFAEFINNVNQQIDFTNEKINCDRFRKNFANEKLVYFPKIIMATNDIVISEFIECIDMTTIPQYKQMMTCYNFTCIISKMMLVDNFVHLDLHHKNWQVQKISNEEDKYRIIIFDFGIVYSANNIDTSRKIWDAFELRDTNILNSIIDDIIIGNITQQIRERIGGIMEYYVNQNLDLNYIFNLMTNILAEYNCKLAAYCLNLALVITLIDSVLKKHNILDNSKPRGNHQITIRKKQLDVLSYCNSNNAYLEYAEIIRNKIKRNNTIEDFSSRKTIFNSVSSLDLDLPE